MVQGSGVAMIATGIDLGGTKIEAQVFDADWLCVDRRRIDTPHHYETLVQAIASQIAWADQQAGRALPVGIGAAGLVRPYSGLVYAANLVAMDRPLPTDIVAAVGRDITYINDCRALTLSEAVFGAGRGKSPVVGLILGTGVGGGLAIGGHLAPGFMAMGGEFGHFTASAQLISQHDLPIMKCGCGRYGCNETLISGPGLTRLARRFVGEDMTAEQLTLARAGNAMAEQAWRVWCDLVADVVITLVFTCDPAVVVIGGGLSKVPELIEDLTAALQRAQLPGFAIPELLLAQGGDASGARGAAYAAFQAQVVV
jgi:N-acetylglucosamine kinase